MRVGIRCSLCLVWLLLTAVPDPPIARARESFRLSPSALSSFGMESGYLWLSGNALIPAGGRPGSGTRVSVSDELGVDQGESTSMVLQSSILDTHLINFEFLMSAPSGLKKVSNTFRLQNKTYRPGTPVETKLDFNWMRLEYGYKLLGRPGWWLAPRIGVHHVRTGITLNGKTVEAGHYSNTRRLDATYPVLGLEARWLFPYGFDVCVEMEGIHLLTRGFLTLTRFSAFWELYPDVIFTLGCSGRSVHCVETNQPLNNQWQYTILGFSGGVSFTF